MTRILSIDPGVRNLTWADMTLSQDDIKLHRWQVIDLLSPDLDIPLYRDYIFTTCTLWTKKQLENFVGDSLKSLSKRGPLKNDYINYIKEKHKCNQKEVDIHILARRLIDFLSIVSFEGIDKIVIENQPAPKNPKMKSIQIILMTYFMMKTPCKIHFISASLKINHCLRMKYIDKKPKGYSETKKLSIGIIESHILHKLTSDNDYAMTQWNAAKKKDDLSDVILQGLAFSKKHV